VTVEKPTIQVTVSTRAPEAGPTDPAREPRERMAPAFTPPIDIHEHPEGLILEADLPGAVEQNLRVQLEDNVLSLYARIDPPVPEGARLLHEEYRLGDYQRSFILGDEVDRERITAELTHGVLRLFLPKADRLRTRRIEIKS
jgi:HSP20 family molecular chaperone IbpA